MVARSLAVFGAVVAAGILALLLMGGSGEGTTNDPGTPQRGAGESDEEKDVETKLATFAAGCFWGVELKFSNTDGVLEATSGYMGGEVDEPSYKQVCTDTTGHAEVVQVTYNPEKVTYEELLDIFWHLHDPTQINGQGPDIGTQYRSAIFYHGEEQQKAAQASKEALVETEAYVKRFGDTPIATQIVPASTFWRAEEYHQDYLAKRGQETCHIGW